MALRAVTISELLANSGTQYLTSTAFYFCLNKKVEFT